MTISKNKCRFCKSVLTETFVDLGMSPIANDYVKMEQEQAMEPFYPLHVFICKNCYLVQLPNHRRENEIFTNDYAYFSSYSVSWLKHAKEYVEMMIERFKFNKESYIVELASNDGYLLQYFKEKDIPVLGIEPTANTAEVAIKKGIPSLVEFFGEDIARKLVAENKQADLIIANNVLAHVPDLNDFVEGIKILLKTDGIVTIEFPHLYQLINKNQFDTIYHEHYSYYSFVVIQDIFAAHGMRVFDVEEISTHGGSLRIFACHNNNENKKNTENVVKLHDRETKEGYKDPEMNIYKAFAKKVELTKRNLLSKLIELKNDKKTIVGYGAPAKGNTLLNYCGIRSDFLDYTVDKNPHKQNHYLPGVHIPIYPVEKIQETKPDYVLILPWNLKEEVMNQLNYIGEWGGKFIISIPETQII